MKSKQTHAEDPNPQINRIVRMLRRIQPWLQSQRARVATFAEIEKWTNVPENTIRGWFAGQGNPSAEFLVGLVERIPDKARLEILDEFSRVYPSLDHARLAGDRTVLSRLTTLLGQSRGFSFIQGGNGELRTFVITALGHSNGALTIPLRRVLGVDVHASDWFVPVPGVVYLNNLLRSDDLRRAVQPAWPQLRNGETPLLIFNGLWSVLPELQQKIRALAERCHVLVADESKLQTNQSGGSTPTRTTLITVDSKMPDSKRIALDIRPL
ncbi:MAG TPA: hypothetical protein VFE51_22385 [Verrucomicrobiae bacterium]|nr:hypothetical protein [Verrucomicrobiae bacterium]